MPVNKNHTLFLCPISPPKHTCWQHTAPCHVYLDYEFYICTHIAYNFFCVIMCICSLYLYYIHKDWSSYKLHKGCRLGRGRRSSSVPWLWKILHSALLLSKTLHGQYALRLKALLNTIYTHTYINMFICIYSKLTLSNSK